MLTVGTDIVHWLHFDYICSLELIVPVATNSSVSGKVKIESMEEYSEAKI